MTNKNLDNTISNSGITFRKLSLWAIFGTLEIDNNIDKISMQGYSEKELIKICHSFRKKFNKKLNYTFANDAYYLSY